MDFSIAPVQAALTQLVRDGFVEVRSARGTFVAPRPPHLAHYGLVFPGLSGEHTSRFYAALRQAGHRS
ncbi:MAG: hypothetical protein ACREIT_01885 [Tepidisphaeraceae bacterium]